jgi:two-component system CheB/CheR fusion protein
MELFLPKEICGMKSKNRTRLLYYSNTCRVAFDRSGVEKILVFIEKHVGSRDGRWFLVRTMPYRTLENLIGGVVITFSNITAAKTLEAQLRQTQSETEKRVEKGTP